MTFMVRASGNYVDYLSYVLESWLIAWSDLSLLAFVTLDSFSAKILKITTKR